MRIPRYALASLAAAIAIGATSVPASAQMTQRYGYNNDWRSNSYDRNWNLDQNANAQIRQDINQLRQALNRSRSGSRLSEREWRGLRQDISRLQDLYSDYARNGLNRREVYTLEQRINTIRQRLRYERRDYDGFRN
jgi:hypothetical protein